jgi:hypothetical protein
VVVVLVLVVLVVAAVVLLVFVMIGWVTRTWTRLLRARARRQGRSKTKSAQPYRPVPQRFVSPEATPPQPECVGWSSKVGPRVLASHRKTARYRNTEGEARTR